MSEMERRDDTELSKLMCQAFVSIDAAEDAIENEKPIRLGFFVGKLRHQLYSVLHELCERVSDGAERASVGKVGE